ncbi:MAG: LOG family protein [Jaaginema sp. PMC 1079.18]|nr:LOG family protein [Jaaginema sp. PMC 1080.18]MEC4849612.1 LOG family protein [Jaaginema sp. PMC 1079.18]MEC4866214.1 LOG family protein [Jaaginema sp. PMC 1078.18]
MSFSTDDSELESLVDDLAQLSHNLPSRQHRKWVLRAFAVLVRLMGEEVDRLDWKILTATLEDLEQAFQVFYPYRHVRKVAMFGSARTQPHTPEYEMAMKFAQQISQRGFMAITGGGGGIMEAGNKGATRDRSFGLNIQLPFEQSSNEYIEGDSKLINFKYFFTRKLFFLRESDAIAIFPGGFGTMDEAFEALTLSQTGKYGPVPLVLVDTPQASYWEEWNEYIYNHLVTRGLVSPEDDSIYTIAHDIDAACDTICAFYRVYHSSRYVKEQFVMRLNCELAEAAVEYLNETYSDILVKGKITKSPTLPPEQKDETAHLPRLVFYYNQKDAARLTQMIRDINRLGTDESAQKHPEWK